MIPQRPLRNPGAFTPYTRRYKFAKYAYMRHVETTLTQEQVYQTTVLIVGRIATERLCREFGGRRVQFPSPWKLIPPGARRAIIRLDKAGVPRSDISIRMDMQTEDVAAVLDRLNGGRNHGPR